MARSNRGDAGDPTRWATPAVQIRNERAEAIYCFAAQIDGFDGLRVGEIAPRSSPGHEVSLWLVLYIYPKDDTPGCTIQGKSFTTTKADFTALDAVVVGLSEDDVGSHKVFCDKFAFKIDLLADPRHTLLSALGIGQSEYKGVKYWDRTTFVVAPDSVVRKVYEKVQPQGHEAALLADLKQLKAKH